MASFLCSQVLFLCTSKRHHARFPRCAVMGFQDVAQCSVVIFRTIFIHGFHTALQSSVINATNEHAPLVPMTKSSEYPNGSGVGLEPDRGHAVSIWVYVSLPDSCSYIDPSLLVSQGIRGLPSVGFLKATLARFRSLSPSTSSSDATSAIGGQHQIFRC